MLLQKTILNLFMMQDVQTLYIVIQDVQSAQMMFP